jgi:uncharacterized protein
MVTDSAKHLLVNTGELPEGTSRLKLTCDADSLELAGVSIRVKGDIRCEFVLTKSGESINVCGLVSFEYSLECSRCLREFVVAGSEEILLHCRKASMKENVREAELSHEDVVVYFYEDNVVNLKTAVRDAVLLSVPMKPLCSSDCKGLCPVCGQNLNLMKCSCAVQVVDGRWDALKGLKSNTGRD